MQLTFLPILAALTLAKAAVVSPPAGFFQSHGGRVAVKEGAYFVTFKGEAGTAAAKSDHEAFRAAVRSQSITVKERLQFTDYVNAISVEVAKEDVKRLALIPNVKDIFPLLTHTPPRTIKKDVSNPALKFADGVTGVKELHDVFGLNGKGIKVGVIDTGIDYKHPALGGCFGKGCRVQYGHDFVGDAYNGQNGVVPDEDPMDCAGHGTHVAGIIGAKDKDFVGVAPAVTLGSYRVFGCEGTTGNDIIIAAMERAAADGMDIINLSLGGGSSWAEYPDSIVADKLADKGLLVVAAMGNDGDKGMWEASSPAMASKGIAVASFDNMRYLAYGFKIAGSDKAYDYSPAKEDQTLGVDAGELASGKNGADDLGCQPYPADSLKGKIALIQRGTCTFVEKGKNAQAAGAVAALIYNKEFGAFTPGADDPTLTIKVAGITQANGQELVALLGKGAVKLTFNKEKEAFDNPTGGKISSFSSWGPGPELEVKPDIGAPGGLIYSTFPLAKGGYATLSGTSMATPYTAGSAALVLQVKGKLKPTETRDLLKQNAFPVTELGTTSITSVVRQGSGLINVRNAILSTTVVSPVSIALKSSDVKSGKVTHITVSNKGKYPLHYTISNLPALAVKSWDANGELLGKPELKDAPAKVDISTTKLTLEPGHSETVSIFFSEPSNIASKDRYLYGGYIAVQPHLTYEDMLNGNFKKQTLITIPYSGLRGDYKSIPILPDPSTGIPALFNGATAAVITKDAKPADNVFSMKDDDTPVAAVRLLHPCKHLIIKVVDNKNKDVGVIVGGDNKFLGRNDATPENLAIQLAWNGKLVGKTNSDSVDAPNGVYRLSVAALRSFGKDEVPSDWQTWSSPVFTLDRSKKVAAPANATAVDAAVQNYMRGKVHGVGKNIEDDGRFDNSVLPRPFKIPVSAQ